MIKQALINHYHTYELGKQDRMKTLPMPAYFAVYFMTLSVLIQGLVDVLIKALSFTPLISTMPWRVNFLFLTAISVLMGYQTLMGIRRRKLEVTRNSVQVGLLVEISLVVGDIIFIHAYLDQIPEALWLRTPFIVFTSINILILLYLISKLRLLRDEKGHWQWF